MVTTWHIQEPHGPWNPPLIGANAADPPRSWLGPETAGASPPGAWQWGQGTEWDSDGVHPASCETLDSDASSMCLECHPQGGRCP